jgi:long-chain acyl-CoA synthetase
MQVTAPASTLAFLSVTASEIYGERTAVRYRRGEGWEQRTFAQAAHAIDELARGLVACGIEPGDRICILADTRVEWTYASMAIIAAGCVVVPMYPSSSPEECRWIAQSSGARAIFCENGSQLAKIAEVRSELPDLEMTFLFDRDERLGDALSLGQLCERGSPAEEQELGRRREAVRPEDPCTIIYTSGSTGPPKGVVLTHRNCSTIGPTVNQLGFVKGGDVSYLHLPLAHVFALTIQLGSFFVGTPIVYYGGDVRQMVAEMHEVKPTFFASVPRVFEKLYALATSTLEGASAEERGRFQEMIDAGVLVRERDRRGEPVADEIRRIFEAAEVELYRNVRGLFGGHLRDAVTGAAPIAPEILRFFFACGVPLLEGWGMTETTGFGTVGTQDAFKFARVGKPIPGMELRVAEGGEIQVCGPNIFLEYWRDPEASERAFTEDGWLRTGDLGSLDGEGYLSIVGRTKEIIITAGGKNLAPANLENELRLSPWISQAIMFGDRRPYPVALVTLEEQEIIRWASERGLAADVETLVGEPAVRELISSEIERVNRKYAGPGQVKRFAVIAKDFTHERGEMTPTLKLKRDVIYAHHESTVEALYRA